MQQPAVSGVSAQTSFFVSMQMGDAGEAYDCASWGRDRRGHGTPRYLLVPSNIRREGGRSLVILEGREEDPL